MGSTNIIIFTAYYDALDFATVAGIAHLYSSLPHLHHIAGQVAP